VIRGCHSSKVQLSFKRVGDGGKPSVNFAAYLTDYSSTHSPRWNNEFVYARMDPIAIYQGTSRTITISWTVLSVDTDNGINNMNKIEDFLALAYPTFDSDSAGEHSLHIKNPPLVEVRFSKMIGGADGVIGYFNSEVSFKPNLEAGFIHTGATNELIPKEVGLSCTIQVLRDIKSILKLSKKGESITRQKTRAETAPGEKPSGQGNAPLDSNGNPIEKKPIDDRAAGPSHLSPEHLAWLDAAEDVAAGVDARAAARDGFKQVNGYDPDTGENVYTASEIRSRTREHKRKQEEAATGRGEATGAGAVSRARQRALAASIVGGGRSY
jgi:hypothetical protein